jgi:metal-responsive CopG/Arc/MetJ family transcriptional regulator
MEYQGIPTWYHGFVKIGVSLPEELVAFADQTAKQRGTSRSVLLARLLEAERVRQQTQRYLDRYGWDVADDEAAWRKYQRRRMAAEYRGDDW